MKKLNILFGILSFVFMLSSCYKDKGNYAYHKINSITVTDPLSTSRMLIFQGDTLRLNPEIAQTTPSDNLSYAWFVYNNSSNSEYDMPRDTIYREKDLNYKITGDVFVLGENYRLTLKVTDNETGVSSVLQYDLSVVNKYGSGWMFLEKNGENGDVSMILPDNSVEHGLYSLLNPEKPIINPVGFTATSFDVTDDLSDPNKRIYIFSENDLFELSNLTFTHKFEMGYLFFSPPKIVKPTYIGWAAYSYDVWQFERMGIAINNGLVHTNMVGGFPGEKKWGDALANPDGKYDYDIAPYVAGATDYAGAYPVVVYDRKYQRFYTVWENSLEAFPPTASTVFDMNDVGLDLLLLDSANVEDRYNAVMKDGNTPYLLQLTTEVTSADPSATVAKIAMNAPGIENATALASSTLTPHIFYAVDNKLYKYETTSNTYASIFDFPAGENITCMDYLKSNPETGEQQLVVASWDGTEGKVYRFTVSAVGNVGANPNIFTGFNKIIGLAYKF